MNSPQVPSNILKKYSTCKNEENIICYLLMEFYSEQ